VRPFEAENAEGSKPEPTLLHLKVTFLVTFIFHTTSLEHDKTQGLECVA